MQTVLLVTYLLIVLAMIGVILLQRSEGGGLGMGGNANGFMSARGTANLLTRTTAILATLFFATAIGLTVLSELNRPGQSILDAAGAATGSSPQTVLDTLLPSDASSAPAETSVAPSAETSTDPGLAVPIIAPPGTTSSAPPASSAAQ